jgi:hypothetical protein
VLLRRKLSVLMAAAMLVIIVSILASCGGSDTKQSEGNRSGGDFSKKEDGGTPTSSEQQNLQVFGKLPKGEPARPGESLQTRVGSEPPGGGVKALLVIPDVNANPSAPLSTQMTFGEFMQWVVDDLNTFWSDVYINAQQQASSPILYLPPVVQGADEAISIDEPNCAQVLGPTFDPDEQAGPVYCVLNGTIYIPPDTRIPSTGLLLHEHGAIALAYLVAHEWGHHLQYLGGLYSVSDPSGSNPYYPYDDEDGLELQADCLAGVWLNSAEHEGQLEPGDFEQAFNFAAFIGDDVLGAPTDLEGDHGRSDERQQWLRAGYDTGDARKCAELQVEGTY